MPKRYLAESVLDAARERTAWTFDRFERIYVAFSGGKDSTVMLHIAAEEARARGRRIAIVFIDLEGQYKLTIEHVEVCMELYSDCADPYWVCLPIHLRNGVSVYEPFWQCWDPDARDAWIRPPPDNSITDPEVFPFFWRGMEFEEFVPLFGVWFAGDTEAACMVGIRADESLNRFRTIASKTKQRLDGKGWTTRVEDGVYNIYPIYDWRTEDIWRYQGQNPELPYNRLYDIMHMAGLTIHQQRICQPYGDDQRRGLWLYHLIEPETWARIVARVNGANSGALYSQESGNVTGYRRISKPDGHTWRSFAMLLIQSMPKTTGEHYWNKVTLFRKWWMDRGYEKGIPDEVDYKLEAARKAPSWRRVVKALLRNDYWCKGLGFTQHKSDAYHKYLDLMRRRREKWRLEEVDPSPGIQTTLFD